MRSTTQIDLLVNVADIEPARLVDLAAQAEVKARKIGKPGGLGVYKVTIDDDLLGAERLRKLLQERGVEVFMRQTRESSAEQVRAAPLVVIRVDREQGIGGPRYGTEFQLDDACPRCGTGARPVGDVMLKASDLPKGGDAFRTFDGEYFISARVRSALSEEGITGAEFHDVRGARGKELLPWSQLTAPFALPPVEQSSSGGLRRQDPCPVCDRDGYFGTAQAPLELRYSLDPGALADVPDLASTYEHFGNSRLAEPFSESFFAQPLLVAKPRVVQVLTALGVRNVSFVPVALD